MTAPDGEQPAASPAHASDAADAAEAVLLAAAHRGIFLPRRTAEEIAAAAISHADGTEGFRMRVPREAWADERARDRARQDMRLRLLDQVTVKALVPVSLPAEKLTYVSARMVAAYTSDHTEDVAAAQVPEAGDWDMVIVDLSVPVRTGTPAHT